MKKALLFLVLILSMVCVSCQATPQESIVKYSDEKQYMDNPVNTSDNQELLKNVPETIERQVVAYNGKLKVSINAKVYVPERTAWPVYRTKLKHFTQEEIDKYISILFGNAELKEVRIDKTQRDYLNDIKDYQLIVDELKDNIQGSKNPEEIEKEIVEYEQYIKELKRMMHVAPKTAEHLTVSSKIIEENGEGFLHVFANIYDELNPWIKVHNYGGYGAYLDYAATNVHFDYDFICSDYTLAYGEILKKNIKKTEIEAINEAQEFLHNLGIEGMGFVGRIEPYQTLTDEVGVQSAYAVIFTRLYNNIPRALAGDDYTVVEAGENEQLGQYTMSVANEKLIVVVDETGPVQIKWECPDQVLYVENDNVRLLSFEQIYSALEDALKVRYAYVNPQKDKNEEALDICIDKICLSYAKINIKNNYSENRIVPAWFFYNNEGKVVLILNATDMSTIE